MLGWWRGKLQHHLLCPSHCGDSLFAGQCHQGTGLLEEEAGETGTGLAGKQPLVKGWGPA